MRAHSLYLPKYDWQVQLYFAVTQYYVGPITRALEALECPEKTIKRAVGLMKENRLDTGFTYSNKRRRESIVVVGLHSSPPEFLNSFEHELRHLVDDIASTDWVDLSGEKVAYLTGELNILLWEQIHPFVCCSCSCH